MSGKAAKNRGGAPKGNQNALGNRGGPGAPTKYDETFPERAFRLTLLGLTDAELAVALGVGETTINAWKHEHVEFSDAIARGKAEADSEVAHSTYQRAKGFTRKAVKIFQYEGEPVYAEYEEYFPPDAQAARYWLNNRQRSKWADRIEHTGPEGGSISFVIEGAPAPGTKS